MGVKLKYSTFMSDSVHLSVYSACNFTKTNFLSFWWFQNLAVHTNTDMLSTFSDRFHNVSLTMQSHDQNWSIPLIPYLYSVWFPRFGNYSLNHLHPLCLKWQVTKSITSIVSNIAQVETEELEAAEEESGAISKFVQAFEEQISHVEVADGRMLNIQQPNVAVQVIWHLYHQNYLISTSKLEYRSSLSSYCLHAYSSNVVPFTLVLNKARHFHHFPLCSCVDLPNNIIVCAFMCAGFVIFWIWGMPCLNLCAWC